MMKIIPTAVLVIAAVSGTAFAQSGVTTNGAAVSSAKVADYMASVTEWQAVRPPADPAAPGTQRYRSLI